MKIISINNANPIISYQKDKAINFAQHLAQQNIKQGNFTAEAANAIKAQALCSLDAKNNISFGASLTDFLPKFCTTYSRIQYLKNDAQIQQLIKNNNLLPQGIDVLAQKERFNKTRALLNNSSMQKLIQNKQLRGSHLLYFSGLDKNAFASLYKLFQNKAFEKFVEEGEITKEKLEIICELDSNELEQFDNLLNKWQIKKLVKDKKINYDTISRFAGVYSYRYEKLNELLDNEKIKELIQDNKIDGNSLPNFLYLQLDDKEFNQATYLMKNGFENTSFTSLLKFLLRNRNIDIEDFCLYENMINYKQLQEQIPEVKSLSPSQKLEFVEHYYKERKLDFNREDLTYCDNLTQYLRENFLDATKIDEIHITHPATPREVGELPSDWVKILGKVDIKRAQKQIIAAIDKFKNSQDIDIFERELSNIFDTDATVEELSSGTYGVVYKISVDNTKDVCLKLFRKGKQDTNDIFMTNIENKHGQCIEIQNLLFANSHCDDFVKFYFGRIGAKGKNDGFMVTQYLTQDTIPETTKKVDNAADYRFKILDDHRDNYKIADGKRICIDAGVMVIIDNKTDEAITRFNY